MSQFGMRSFLLTALALLFAGAASAAPPTIRNLDRLGLQIGGSTVLTIDGDNLLPEPKLVLPVPIVKQILQPKGTANRVIIEVTLDKTAVPGLYNLRLANANGVSAGRVVAVDHLPQRTWEPKVAALPVSLHGALTGSGKMTTSFVGKAGQAILCEVEAQRLGGKLKPVLHLYDEGGRQLAWSLPSSSLGGDARISATLPAEGLYTVEVHDSQYAGGPPGNFRLKLGSWQYVDAVFPPAVPRGNQLTSVELLGNTAGQRIAVQAVGKATVVPVPWADAATASGLRPRVLVSDLPEVVEKDGAALQEVAAVPVALNGRIAKPGEIDRFRLPVQPAQRLRFEVFADRLGSPMDAVLKLERDNGTLLAQADDTPGSPDPRLDFTVPADVKSLVVVLEDLNGRGGPNCIYRVVVRPISADSAVKDFRLFLPSAELNVPVGASRIVEVAVEREGYTGPIRLGFEGLPGSGSVQGVDVPAGANGALVTLTGGGPAPATALTAPARHEHRSEVEDHANGPGTESSSAKTAALARGGTGHRPDSAGETRVRRTVGGRAGGCKVGGGFVLQGAADLPATQGREWRSSFLSAEQPSAAAHQRSAGPQPVRAQGSGAIPRFARR